MPQRRIDNVRPECTRSLQCQLCQSVQLYTSTAFGKYELDCGNLSYFRDRFFHDTCTTCPPTELSLEPLCSFCNHLRLPHIFGCVTPELESLSSRWTRFFIEWGKGYTELLEDQACPLCALISSTLRKHTTKMDQDDGKSFDDSVSVVFCCRRDESGKLGPWQLFIYLFSSATRQEVIVIGEMNVAKDGSGKATYIEPLIGPDLNWDLVRRWVWKCHLYHQDHPSQKIPIDTTDKDFRLIDVRSYCLVRASNTWPYAALSYVWGDVGAREAQAVQANVLQLQEEGLLLHELPQCILDALKVCRKLGVKFLWVDRLCIVQDDADSKHGQIKQMGSIYASAIVTIVAAAGDNAGHGLVGVCRPSASAQLRQKLALQGFESTENLKANDFSESIQQSVWRSRGWTFQEEKLSTALLVFSECGVSFQCKHRPGRMEIEIEGPTESDDVRTDPSTLYPSVVSEYSRRTLSFGSDILNAFSGYLGMEFNDQHYFGLPCAYFTQALLWKSADQSGLPRKSNGNETFPSWSWASITGAIDYQSWLLPERHEPVASWAAILFPPGSTNPQLLLVREVASKLSFLQRLLRKNLPWHYLLKEHPWGTLVLTRRLLSPILHGELSRLWTTLPRRMKSYEGFWFQNAWLWMKHNLLSNANLGLDPGEIFRPGRLLAYTQTASVSVTRMLWPTSFVLNEEAPFVLRNKWGKWIGFVDPDRPTVERIDACTLRGEIYLVECLALCLHRKNARQLPLLLDEEFDTLQDRETEPEVDEEAMKIFRRRSHDFWAEMGCLRHRIRQANKRNAKDSYERSSKSDPELAVPPQLTVMMVERTEGIARRVGVGNVYLRRWRESAPSFQTVVLD